MQRFIMLALVAISLFVVAPQAKAQKAVCPTAPLGDGGNRCASAATDAELKREYLHAKDFGAVGNGAADDTAALQNWINACQTYVNTCFLDAGAYKITSALSITSAITIIGANPYTSIINPATTINGLNISTPNVVQLEKFGITYSSAAANATSAVTVTATGGTQNVGFTLKDVTIQNAYNVIVTSNTALFTIDNLRAYGFAGVGIEVSDSVNVDVGDSVIVNSMLFASFSASPATFGAAAIHWMSSGGIRIVNNKIASVHYGILTQLANAAATAQMIVADNSFDTSDMMSMSFTRQGATGTFGNVLIDNNLFTNVVGGISVPPDANGNWLTVFKIANNTYIGQNSASAVFASIQSTNSLTIANNLLYSNNAATVGVTVGASVMGCMISGNTKGGTFASDFVGPTCAFSNSGTLTSTGDIRTLTHYLNASGVPTVSACGASPAVTAGSNNNSGEATTGAAAPTACTVTFSTAYPTHAFCTITPEFAPATATAYISAISASAFTVTFSAGVTSGKFMYSCGGN